MKFPSLDSPRTGILVAVSSLRSTDSRGIGEFRDLKKLGDWCAERSVSVVQILPVNDTGIQQSPYSALSAFALHPVYLSIEALPEYPSAGMDDLRQIPTTSELDEPVDFVEIVRQKESILAGVYDDQRNKLQADAEFNRWIDENPWVRTYSVFRALRVEHDGRASMDWPEGHRSGARELIDQMWTDGGALSHEPRFYAWMQWRLEQQLVEASEYLQSVGVYLKGDLPILMNEDSADVWANPRIFQVALRAGAPPDMFSELGQNWDFPIYDWDYLEETGFAWWKMRLLQADKYYHAYRIDHVLGFFRIWAIPERSFSGTLGYFVPYPYLTPAVMRSRGFDDGRITWLAEPHLTGDQIRSWFAQRPDVVIDKAFRRVGHEDLYRFRDEIRGERDILDLELSDDEIDTLLEHYRDRALIRVDDEEYFPAWALRECTRYESLSGEEKGRFESMVTERAEEAERMWEHQGRRLLTFMSSTAEMLTCAEDLGVVPRSVPEVLESLGILGLRIPRWTRHYQQPEEPYLTPGEYPPLTICATSVHDTSTMRGWWTDEADRQPYWESLGLDGEAPEEFSPAVAQTIYEALAPVQSAILLFQIQDLFDLDSDLRRQSASADRVNVPGTVAESNWSYRWPVPVEELSSATELNRRVDLIIDARTAGE